MIKLILTQSVWCWMTRSIYVRELELLKQSWSTMLQIVVVEISVHIYWEHRAMPEWLIPFHLLLFKHHQSVRPLPGQWDTCDGSQLFTYHSSLESVPSLLKINTSKLEEWWKMDIRFWYKHVYWGRGERRVGSRSQWLVFVWEGPPEADCVWKKGKEHWTLSVWTARLNEDLA